MIVGTGCTIGLGYWTAIIQHAHKSMFRVTRGGGGGAGFYKFFKTFFVAQETIDLNISWPSNFFRKYFMAPPISFSFLFKAYL